MGENGAPSVVLNDEKEMYRAALGQTDFETKKATAVSSLVLYDSDGEVIWKTP